MPLGHLLTIIWIEIITLCMRICSWFNAFYNLFLSIYSRVTCALRAHVNITLSSIRIDFGRKKSKVRKKIKKKQTLNYLWLFQHKINQWGGAEGWAVEVVVWEDGNNRQGLGFWGGGDGWKGLGFWGRWWMMSSPSCVKILFHLSNFSCVKIRRRTWLGMSSPSNIFVRKYTDLVQQ